MHVVEQTLVWSTEHYQATEGSWLTIDRRWCGDGYRIRNRYWSLINNFVAVSLSAHPGTSPAIYSKQLCGYLNSYGINTLRCLGKSYNGSLWVLFGLRTKATSTSSKWPPTENKYFSRYSLFQSFQNDFISQMGENNVDRLLSFPGLCFNNCYRVTMSISCLISLFQRLFWVLWSVHLKKYWNWVGQNDYAWPQDACLIGCYSPG